MSWKFYNNKKISTERAFEVLRRPLVTEKFTRLAQHNQVAFEVNGAASKHEIKQAVEMIFKVKVAAVNTVNIGGKTKYFRGMKGKKNDIRKAVVTLVAGQTIDLGATV